MVRLGLSHNHASPLCILLLHLVSLRSVFAVDIIMRSWNGDDIECHNIPPGVCCLTPTDHQQDSKLIEPISSCAYKAKDRLYSDANVTFHHLHALDIASVWEVVHADARIIGQKGCGGRSLDSSQGPGTWNWGVSVGPPLVSIYHRRRPVASGASYVTMPQALPPGGTASDWLSMQGMFGMAWGGSKTANQLNGWLSSGPDAKAWVQTAAGSTLRSALAMKRRRSRSNVRRDVILAAGVGQGQVWIGPPPKARFPNTFSVNGTKYEDQGKLDGTYADSTGEVVDLKSLFLDWNRPDVRRTIILQHYSCFSNIPRVSLCIIYKFLATYVTNPLIQCHNIGGGRPLTLMWWVLDSCL